jgi:hypothetical protein
MIGKHGKIGLLIYLPAHTVREPYSGRGNAVFPIQLGVIRKAGVIWVHGQMVAWQPNNA